MDNKCTFCSKGFTPTRKDQKYCSVSCSLRGSKPERFITCVDCGITFTHKGRGRCYRCETCRKVKIAKTAADWQLKHRTKNPGVGSGGAQWETDNHQWKSDKDPKKRIYKGDYRSRCLKLWDKKCVICEVTKRITVHHIDGDQKNFLNYNLIPLCFSCHKKVHYKRWKTPQEYEAALFKLWPKGRIKIAEKTGTPSDRQPEVKEPNSSRND